jgi:Curli production assembly/transport component CsgG
MKKHPIIYLLLCCAAFLGSCSFSPPLPKELRFVPPTARLPDLGKIKTVAIFEFDNLSKHPEAGARILGKLTACLAVSPKFHMVERKQLQRVHEEIALALSDATSTDGFLKAGKLAGADAVLVGEISGFSAEAMPLDYTYSRSGTSMMMPLGPGMDRRGPLGIPAEKRTYQIMRFSASVSFSGRLIDIESGRVLYSVQANRSFAVREGEYEINSELSLLDQLVELAVNDFCYPFNPEGFREEEGKLR